MKIFLILILIIVNIITSYGLSKLVKEEDPAIFLTQHFGIFIPVSKDFHTLLGNMGLINTLAYAGKKIEEKGYISKEEALKVYMSLDTISLLNTSYFDVYYVTNALLTWDAEMYEEAIEIEKRGLAYIRDWRLPFYIGFNYFFFLNDNEEGAYYIKLAMEYDKSKRNNLLPLLASRLYYEEGKIDVAIGILREQIRVIKDERLKEALKKRLESLKKIRAIYNAMKIFEEKFGRSPNNIKELEEARLIPAGLRDSYGGRFYITKEGKVRSEIEFRYLHTKKNYRGKGIHTD